MKSVNAWTMIFGGLIVSIFAVMYYVTRESSLLYGFFSAFMGFFAYFVFFCLKGRSRGTKFLFRLSYLAMFVLCMPPLKGSLWDGALWVAEMVGFVYLYRFWFKGYQVNNYTPKQFARRFVRGITYLGLYIFLSSLFAVLIHNHVTREYSGDLQADIRQNVSQQWNKISSKVEKTAGKLEVSFKNKKAMEFFWTPKKSMRKSLSEIRELLLPVDSRAILANIEKTDRSIASLNTKIEKLNHQRLAHPEKSESIDKKIEKFRAKKAQLEGQRKDEAATILANLKAIGLDLGGDAAWSCIFPENVNMLIDNAVVAKNISVVVENLRSLMDSEDRQTAKRYFGMYVIMIDVQAECFRQYLDKSQSGEWTKGINKILLDAETAKLSDEAKATDGRFSEEEKKTFLANAATNQRTVDAAKAYLELLESHENIVREKLHEVARVHELAMSSYDSVVISGNFLATVKSGEKAFDAMLELTLPPLAVFEDRELQTEFQNITQKLKQQK